MKLKNDMEKVKMLIVKNSLNIFYIFLINISYSTDFR